MEIGKYLSNNYEAISFFFLLFHEHIDIRIGNIS